MEKREYREGDFLFTQVLLKDLEKYIMKIDRHKSSGVNYTNANVLKDYLLCIKPQLKTLIDNCLTKGIFPDKWAEGTLVPIPKKGNLNNSSNWRPITLLPTMGKIMERVVHGQLMDHLTENQLLSSKQFGFTPGRCTADAVHDLTKDIYNVVNRHKLSSCL